MASYAAVAHAIAHFEPVLMLARPGEGAVARSYLGRDVEVVELPIDDSWLRDSGPIFVTHPDGTLAMSDFTFNSWGEKYVPYDNDAAIGRGWPSTSAWSASPPRWSSRAAASPSTARAR